MNRLGFNSFFSIQFQFRSFLKISIPIPIPLIPNNINSNSIPIQIISNNFNSNSNSSNFNSNSNTSDIDPSYMVYHTMLIHCIYVTCLMVLCNTAKQLQEELVWNVLEWKLKRISQHMVFSGVFCIRSHSCLTTWCPGSVGNQIIVSWYHTDILYWYLMDYMGWLLKARRFIFG